MTSACCDMFDFMVKSGSVACVEEDEWTNKLTILDGWYLMKRAYDSWWGNYKRGEKWKVCPWCTKPLPPLYMNEGDERTFKEQHNGETYATGTAKFDHTDIFGNSQWK